MNAFTGVTNAVSIDRLASVDLPRSPLPLGRQ